ncbi:MAG: hypothetical protein IRY84_18280, partial [Thermobispora bispora]|nr:hypothetical protein [Thermobispora bispora]
MAKSTSVALAIGAMLAGGAVVAGVPLVATPAGAATMSAQHGLVLLGHPHARGQRKRHKKGHRLGQRLWEKQRQHQFLMRDLTLVLVPYQKEATDAQALPYNWQYDGSVAQQYGDQDQLSTLDNLPEGVEINVDGDEHNGKTEVSPKADKHEVEVESKERPTTSHVDPIVRQGDIVSTAPDVPLTVSPVTGLGVESQTARSAAQTPVQPATEPAAQPSEPVVCDSAGTPLLSLPLNISL